MPPGTNIAKKARYVFPERYEITCAFAGPNAPFQID